MNILLQQLKQTNEAIGKEFLSAVQEAAKNDAHHYEVLRVDNFQAVPFDTYVKLTGQMFISGKQSGNYHVMRGLMDVTLENAGYSMEYWDQGNCHTGNWFYTFETHIDLPPAKSTNILSIAWDDIEDITGYAIYEVDDVPAQLTWNGTEYLLLKAEEGTADYERQIKQ